MKLNALVPVILQQVEKFLDKKKLKHSQHKEQSKDELETMNFNDFEEEEETILTQVEKIQAYILVSSIFFLLKISH